MRKLEDERTRKQKSGMEYKTRAENKAELLAEARTMTVRALRDALRERWALHTWAVEAYEKALAEKGKATS